MLRRKICLTLLNKPYLTKKGSQPEARIEVQASSIHLPAHLHIILLFVKLFLFLSV